MLLTGLSVFVKSQAFLFILIFISNTYPLAAYDLNMMKKKGKKKEEHWEQAGEMANNQLKLKLLRTPTTSSLKREE